MGRAVALGALVGLLGVFARIVPFFARRVLAEDNAVCEGQQSVARQITEDQRLSPAFETRIGWFEETYAAEMSAARERVPPQPPM